MDEKTIEKNLRHKLQTMGYQLRKSRKRNYSLNDLCGYMIIDLYSNCVVRGERYDLSLDDVRSFVYDN